MSASNEPESCEALLAAMVSFDTVNPRFGSRPDGEAALIAPW